MTADLARLAAVLEGELRSGCADTLVEGGLDELLRLQARDEPPRSPLLRMVAALPAAGYRSLDAEGRRSWLRRARATIAQEQGRATNGAPAATRPRKRAPATSPPAPPEGATPRRKAAPRKPPPDPIPEGEAALEWPIARAGTRLGARNLDRLERLGLGTVGDALRHYPHRFHDFSVTVPIAALRVGEEQTVRGAVDRARPVRMGRGGRMQVCEATITDETGARLRVVWFNQPWLAQQLPPGTEIALSGTVKAYRGRPTIDNPAFEKLGGEQRETGRLVPVYPSTQGLAQRTLRTTIAGLLDRFAERLPETLPEELRAKHDLPGIVEATRQMHYPDSKAALDVARRRIAFDELLAIQIGVVRRKREWRSHGDAPAFAGREAIEEFLGTLPFELTEAQRSALDAMLEDLAREQPMARLLQGDVGSGKTVVALAAMIGAVAAGHQAVLMAPTEVLAEQHFRTICGVLSGEPEPPLNGVVSLPFLPLPLRVVLLTGSTRAKERRDALEAIRHGGAHLIVGTHALIQQGVDFQRLGLAVVDEQHRFGVMQRSALRQPERTDEEGVEAASTAHLLVMTATPIPRSLALTIYGDLDLTVIDELPPGRTPIETTWLPPHDRGEAFAALRAEVEAGRQGFVICPLVEGSDAVVSRAATEEYERLCREQFPDLADRIALLHGRMSGRDKDAVMQRFARGEASILVSTAVVEVGIDVPNATVMLIEGADRFGLSQLHQFRGRVGRGEHPSTCYLLADDPSPEAQERLSLVAGNRDGFALAQADLELRGPGELFGTRQAGTPSLRVASLLDARLIDTTRVEAEALLEADPQLAAPPHAALRTLVERAEAGLVAEAH
ncbi:MAG: ATP-dependent DNA helicase RecG [Chloroflexi bacterium]|nr:ATP-dependent DNA helicase RecG [Chloroflexota bacterium]